MSLREPGLFDRESGDQAMVISFDVSAKALQTFVRANPLLLIKLGFVEGKVLQPAELKALADLPSKDALRSQLVGALQGPASQLVSRLAAPQRELVQVLEARSKSGAQSSTESQ